MPHLTVTPERDQIRVRFGIRRLAHDTTESFGVPVAAYQGKRVRLELEPVQFAEPFGLIFLYLYVHQLMERGAAEIDLTIPIGALRTYLVRMDVYARLQEDFGVRVRPWALPVFRRDLKNRLIELRRCDVTNEDEAEDLSQRLLDLMVHQRRRDLSPLTEALYEALIELISNVVVHSGRKEVLVAAQTYHGRVHLAIGDAGIGIPNRLRGAGIAARLSDHDLVAEALKERVSTRVGRGGMGLTMLSDRIRRHGAYLAIRSGEGHVVVRPDGTRRRGGCDRVPGTIVEAVW